ncbi:hypothetical protein HYDPIDRAFT_114444 [Hydnomerulius pinastri MD-312]|uniref:Aldehyde dehydrogenase n=1 Tax=Hydnomerulius pinastri MD-312 TaxID=994086 RepID=A0A0C9VW23_9AGAM|nr:hypothetical protein HYDPIDRAFT_114444 [Hydnomerulius pinastri MD-312]
MSNLELHTNDKISQAHKDLRQTFLKGTTLPLEFRRHQLLQVARLAQEKQEAILSALEADLGRHPVEAYLPEIGPIVASALGAVQCLDDWARPENPHISEQWRSNWNTTIHKAPKGVVVIISPWNYPWIITFGPLIGAIAAGCTVLIKPSEHSPACAKLMQDLVSEYLDPRAFRVVQGAVDETAHILSLKWDHIFFTGSTRVGRIVAEAAGKNLTPVTLELGGQCPVFVDGKNTNLSLAAKRILWGKQQNAGQVCVAPNHVFVEKEFEGKLVSAFGEAAKSFWPDGALDAKSNLARIVNKGHFKHLQSLLARTKGLIKGGKTEGLRMEPTFVHNLNVPTDDVLMTSEIFGPILPIISVNSVDEAIENIRSGPTPLVLYVFTEDQEVKNKFIQQTQSGQLIFQETFGQLAVPEIPFGGQGDSGYGAYLGKYSFDTFTHLRGSIDVPLIPEVDAAMALKYPPYNPGSEAFAKYNANLPIPDKSQS